jgi:1,4-dihydroxy-2-naphthoate octaprenyltransferase
LPLVGFGYAHWERGSTVSLRAVVAPLALLAGSWLLGHAGAMWLNAARDRDRGPVLFGRPTPVPVMAPVAAYIALLASTLLASALGVIPLACAATCALLAIAYSHPRTALKGSPLGGPLVNGLGYGALSPTAGWAAADPTLTWRAGLSLLLAVAFILGTYFAAQVFQADDDARRGDRTLVVTHGPARTLALAHACLRFSVLGLLVAAALGVYPRLLWLSLPAWLAAEHHLETWRTAPASDRCAGLVGRLALGTLCAVLLVYADQFWLLAREQAPGGCGTAILPLALEPLCR